MFCLGGCLNAGPVGKTYDLWPFASLARPSSRAERSTGALSRETSPLNAAPAGAFGVAPEV